MLLNFLFTYTDKTLRLVQQKNHDPLYSTVSQGYFFSVNEVIFNSFNISLFVF